MYIFAKPNLATFDRLMVLLGIIEGQISCGFFGIAATRRQSKRRNAGFGLSEELRQSYVSGN